MTTIFSTPATLDFFLDSAGPNGGTARAHGVLVQIKGRPFVQVTQANAMAELMGIEAGFVTPLDSKWRVER